MINILQKGRKINKYYNDMLEGTFKNTLCAEDNNILLRWILECCLEIKTKR